MCRATRRPRSTCPETTHPKVCRKDTNRAWRSRGEHACSRRYSIALVPCRTVAHMPHKMRRGNPPSFAALAERRYEYSTSVLYILLGRRAPLRCEPFIDEKECTTFVHDAQATPLPSFDRPTQIHQPSSTLVLPHLHRLWSFVAVLTLHFCNRTANCLSTIGRFTPRSHRNSQQASHHYYGHYIRCPSRVHVETFILKYGSTPLSTAH